jgi:hypothetical protein
MDANPVLKNLGNQEGIRDKLKAKFGDIDNDPVAAQNAANFLNQIKALPEADGTPIPDSVLNDGKLDGFTKDGDARHGTDAGAAIDALNNPIVNGQMQMPTRLPTTSDSHVNPDGTNQDNFQWFCGQAGKVLGFIPGLSNVLEGIDSGDGNTLDGALEGAFGGVESTLSGEFSGLLQIFKV